MTPRDASFDAYEHGIRENLHQFSHQLLQVFFVGLTIGMMRTVVPALAESEASLWPPSAGWWESTASSGAHPNC